MNLHDAGVFLGAQNSDCFEGSGYLGWVKFQERFFVIGKYHILDLPPPTLYSSGIFKGLGWDSRAKKCNNPGGDWWLLLGEG